MTSISEAILTRPTAEADTGELEEERSGDAVGRSVTRVTRSMARRPTSESDRAEEGRPGDELGHSMSHIPRSVAHRPMSQVSASSAASRASAEAHISARLKELRVRHLEQGQKRKQHLRQQEDEFELQKAKDDAEEARLEAQLRAEMEDDLNADRRDDFLHEGLGEPNAERRALQRLEYARPSFRSIEPVSNQSIKDAPAQDAPSSAQSSNQVTWIDQLRPPTVPQHPQQANVASAFTKSIPRLTLPTYSGKPSEWPRWIGLFRALVHDQPSLSDAERMAHLQASVSGQAREAVSGMLYDGNLYQHALKTLQQRFGQSSEVIRVHLDSVFSAQPPRENDTASLTTFQSALHCAVTLMKSQGYQSDLTSTENLRRTVIKLPQYLRRKWTNRVIKPRPKQPSLLDLDTWLLTQVQAALLCPAGETQSSLADEKRKRIKEQPAKRTTLATATSSPAAPSSPSNQRTETACPKCGGDHKLFRCRQFNDLNVEARVDLVFAKGLCLWCLQKGHLAKDCHNNRPCGVDGCQRRHNQLLHGGSIRNARPTDHATTTDGQPAGRGGQEVPGGETRVVTASTRIGKTTGTLLQIVPVRIHGENEDFRDTYALLDPGAESSLCNEAVLNRLNLRGQNGQLCLQTVEGTGRPKASAKVKLELSSLASNETRRITVPEAWSVPSVNIDMPNISKSHREGWRHIQDLDIPECSGGQVELLLGANVSEAIIQQEIRTGQPGQPIAVRTAFGWTLTGAVSDLSSGKSRQVMFIQKGSARETELDNMLKDWWTTDAFGTKYDKPVSQSKEDKRAQDILEKTTTKRPDNRYETGLLWKDDNITLPDSKKMAIRRLIGTEKRLKFHPEKAAAYQATIESYVEKGYAKKLTPEEAKEEKPNRWYLPHHAVTNPNKPRKFRVVFDAAAQAHGTSLNNKLLAGPDLLRNLVGVLLRFREEAVAMVADIQEMYHQLHIIRQDKAAQSFLWRDLNEAKEPDVYEMQVAIFGAKSSPALANYVLRRTIADHAEEVGLRPETAEALPDNFYMDDFLGAEKTAEEAKEMRTKVTELLAKGGFRLVKWTSNAREVLESIPQEEQAHPELDLYSTHLPAEGALGVVWDAEQDTLGFRFRSTKVPATKRGVLRKTASIFDPLGIAAPFLITTKLLMQRLWTLQVDWDDELQGEERRRWENWLQELPNLREVRTNRCLLAAGEQPKQKELHVFCDASTDAFGAVAYLRTTSPDMVHHTSFVISKTRVAPLKQLSVARLELQAAVLAVRLVETLQREVPSLAQITVTYWSDSKVVLGYINNESRRFHTFVANRVSEIHDLSRREQWRHCPGVLNPADKCTRGVPASELCNDSTWLTGPDFLKEDEEHWPAQSPVRGTSPADPEVKAEVNTYLTVVSNAGSWLPDAAKYSSWIKYKRTTARMLRFVNNCQAKTDTEEERQLQTGPLQATELRAAEEVILRSVQEAAYGEEIKALKKRRPDEGQKIKSTITNLSPILDERGIMRVGGRLSNAPLQDEARHPVLLPPKSDVTRLIIEEHHRGLLHAGVEHTLNDVRQQYWIPKGRAQVKKTLHRCAVCRNRRARPQTPRMADLPAERFDASKVFGTVGLDFFGPLLVRKFRRTETRFGLLFTCMATRAIHLECVCFCLGRLTRLC